MPFPISNRKIHNYFIHINIAIEALSKFYLYEDHTCKLGMISSDELKDFDPKDVARKLKEITR